MDSGWLVSGCGLPVFPKLLRPQQAGSGRRAAVLKVCPRRRAVSPARCRIQKCSSPDKMRPFGEHSPPPCKEKAWSRRRERWRERGRVRGRGKAKLSNTHRAPRYLPVQLPLSKCLLWTRLAANWLQLTLYQDELQSEHETFLLGETRRRATHAHPKAPTYTKYT